MAELHKVGALFREALSSNYGMFNNRFNTLAGWIEYFRQQITKFPKGRGFYWAMLGYALLARPETSLQEIREVIESHARQDASKKWGNRLDIHLQKQRAIVNERFGVKT
jgi:hypothetical protein